MTTLWCRYALLPSGTSAGVRITLGGDRITAVGRAPRPEPGDEVWDGLTVPGFANAHSHAFHRALRGRTHAGGGTFWTWRNEMYAVAARLDPERYRALATAVFAEMLLAGYTVVGEFHYLHHDREGHPYGDRNAMGLAVVEAARDAGIRLTLLDTLYLAGGLTDTGYVGLDQIQRRFGDETVDAWAARVSDLDGAADVDDGDLRTRLGAAAHSVRAVPPADLARFREAVETLETARGHGLPVHVHVSEQTAENDVALARHGATPVGLLDAAGLVRPGFAAVHATHLTGADIATLGRAGASACFCPTTERDLADGIGPARALLDAGARLCLGSDQQAVIDPFEEVRGLEMHERLVSHERGRFTLEELGAAASASGYRSLGWDDGGTLQVGALADLVCVRIDSVRTAGSEPGQAAFSATAADVVHTAVAGEVVVRDGVHDRLGDVADLLHRALAASRKDGPDV